MTAAELNEIVKDVSREAWPEGLQLYDKSSEPFFYRFDYVIPAYYAALMFIGSMTQYLADESSGIQMGSGREGGYGVRDTWSVPRIKAQGDTLIEALAAACKAQKGAGDVG